MRRESMSPEVRQLVDRRDFLRTAVAGTVVLALSDSTYALAQGNDPRLTARRPDGRPRVPPGQRLLTALRPMGGEPGDPNPGNWHLNVHGECDRPFTVDYAALLRMPQTTQNADVHCVTGWTVLDAAWTGVLFTVLAQMAGVRPTARYVIFEAANGYTTNVPLRECMRPNVMVAHHLNGDPLPRPNGPPVRGLVPDLYFWKSAKWLTGISFSNTDRPGYWETRGYHNHADPWTQERYG